MSKNSADILAIFKSLRHEIRWPTAKWLMSDMLGLIDYTVTREIEWLLDHGYLRCDKGGWLTVVWS